MQHVEQKCKVEVMPSIYCISFCSKSSTKKQAVRLYITRFIFCSAESRNVFLFYKILFKLCLCEKET